MKGKRAQGGATISDKVDLEGEHTLGTGYSAAAFATKKDQVLKVYSSKDTAYHEFAKYAKDNPSEHLPKIHAMGKIKGTPYHYVKMEKLKKLSRYDSDDDKELLDNLDNAVAGKENGWMRHQQRGKTISKNLENYGAPLESSRPGIHNTLKDLAEKHPKRMFDLHKGNIMKRENGVHVITDPFMPTSLKRDLKEMTVRDVSKKLRDHGYEHHRSSGSHEVWKHKSGKGKIIPIPRHKGDLAPGTAKSILRSANIIERFLQRINK